jgi:hypothetical protein
VAGLSPPVVIGHGSGLTGSPALPAAALGATPLPVAAPLRGLFVEAGLRRGSVVAVTPGAGATALVLALLAAPLAAGSWAGIVGMRGLGLEAAAGLGVRLDRLALVPEPGTNWATVTAALLDALDVVVVVPPRRCRPIEVRRLVERVRQRAAVLVIAGLEPADARAWSERPDVELATEVIAWEGLGTGYGTLRRRQVAVSSAGRRGADRRLEARVWLPDPAGQLAGGASVVPGAAGTPPRALRVARRSGALARAG